MRGRGGRGGFTCRHAHWTIVAQLASSSFSIYVGGVGGCVSVIFDVDVKFEL